MKAIMMIDLPVALEHLLGEEMLLYINHKDRQYIMTETAVLRPLPELKPMTKAGRTYNPWEDEYRRGWNACIEEIEK